MLNLQGALSYHKMMMSLRSDAGPGGGWTSPSCNVFVEPKISCSFFVFADVCTFSDAPPYKNASYIRRKSSQIRSRMKKRVLKNKKTYKSISVCLCFLLLTMNLFVCVHVNLLCSFSAALHESQNNPSLSYPGPLDSPSFRATFFWLVAPHIKEVSRA